MKLTNTTHLPDRYYRKMISWICKHYEYPVRWLVSAQIGTTTKWLFSGARGGYRGIRFKINFNEKFPVNHTYAGRDPKLGWPLFVLNDVDDLIFMLAAHELYHCVQTKKKISMGEKDTDRQAKRAYDEFQKVKNTLLADWKRTKEVKPQDIKSERAAKAEADLKRWERKAKLAKTKVALYKRKVAYYQKQGVKP